MSTPGRVVPSVQSLRAFVLLLLHCWVAVGLPAAHAATEAGVRASFVASPFADGPERDRAFGSRSIGALAPDADAHNRGSCTLCRAAEAPAEAVGLVSRQSDERVVIRPEIAPPRLAVAAAAATPSARAPPPLS